MSIVFMGTPDFAVASLDAIIKAGIQVKAVVTAPDKPAGRGHKLQQSAVKQYAVQAGIPVLQPEKLRSEAFLDELRSVQADLFAVVAFRMLPKVVWDMPPNGTINLHASLLPDYRGAAPINWAIINGEQTTGATTFFIREEIDTGDIIDKTEVEIHENMTAGELHDVLMEKGATLLVETIHAIFNGTATSIPQDELKNRAIHEAPKLNKENTRIDWNRPASELVDLIHGLSPWPGAWCYMNMEDSQQRFKIYRCREMAHDGLPAGTLRLGRGEVLVGTGSGSIKLEEVQRQGKPRMSATDFANGLSGTDFIQLS